MFGLNAFLCSPEGLQNFPVRGTKIKTKPLSYLPQGEKTGHPSLGGGGGGSTYLLTNQNLTNYGNQSKCS